MGGGLATIVRPLLSKVDIGGNVILFWLDTGMNNRGRLATGEDLMEGVGEGWNERPGGDEWPSSCCMSLSSE